MERSRPAVISHLCKSMVLGTWVRRIPMLCEFYNADLLRLVPLNQPEPSLDFLNRWIGGEWF
jgi:hypothetical protein